MGQPGRTKKGCGNHHPCGTFIRLPCLFSSDTLIAYDRSVLLAFLYQISVLIRALGSFARLGSFGVCYLVLLK